MKFLIALIALSAAAAHAATPCTTVATCTDWVTIGGGPWRSKVYATYPLAAPNPQITRAMILVHGTNRDADNYFRTATAGAFLAGALENTIVISPRIASSAGSCHDVLDTNEVSYSCSGDSWRSGGNSVSSAKITSFDFVDEILRRLADKQVFPNLKVIVVAGHSAGGQYVNRYSMANQIHDSLGVPVSYIVSNPSSYAWLDATRPDPVAAACTTTFNKWPYGLEERKAGAAARQSEEQLKAQLAARPVTYLLGEIDILPLGGFDSSCSAMSQGATRLARGQAFAKYVNAKTGAKHNMIVVPLCGHNARCMFTSELGIGVAFPKN